MSAFLIDMNPVKQRILKVLKNLPHSYSPIGKHARTFLSNGALIDLDDSIKIGHRPWVAPYNFLIVLFPGIPKAWIKKVKTDFGIDIPKAYQEFLHIFNGAELYGCSLFGVPGSIAEKGLLNRSTQQALDLTSANRNWRLEYRGASEMFHFGAREVSDKEIVGFFVDKDGKFLVMRKSGDRISEFPDLPSLINTELDAAENYMRQQTPNEYWD